jgi:hypothetical protein
MRVNPRSSCPQRHADQGIYGRRDPRLAAAFAITITVQTGAPLVGAILFPVGFCMLYLLGFDLLTVCLF